MNFTREIKIFWNMNMTVVLIAVGALGREPKCLAKRGERIRKFEKTETT